MTVLDTVGAVELVFHHQGFDVGSFPKRRYGVRLASGMVHSFETRAQAERSSYWPKGDDRCECRDPGCPCEGKCRERAAYTLWRVDMEDVTGTRFCQECGEDALNAGVFFHEEPNHA